jgi:hypothetical protein
MKLPRTHIETDREKVERLEQFRGLVQTRMVQFWSEQYELAAKISSALPALITSHPRPGLVPATIAGAPDPPRSTIQKNGTTEKVTLKAGQTQDAFDGQVFISLIGTSFEGDPLRYKVTATVGGPGAKPVSIAKQDIGFTIRFKQFDVRVLESGTFAATFAITE